jgi:hypothetical protein
MGLQVVKNDDSVAKRPKSTEGHVQVVDLDPVPKTYAASVF